MVQATYLHTGVIFKKKKNRKPGLDWKTQVIQKFTSHLYISLWPTKHD